MAKTYIKPETKTFKVEQQLLLTESLNGKGVYDTDVTLGAKGFSFEEEEEMSEE